MKNLEIISKEELQKVQDLFCNSTGLVALIKDIDGTPITTAQEDILTSTTRSGDLFIRDTKVGSVQVSMKATPDSSTTSNDSLESSLTLFSMIINNLLTITFEKEESVSTFASLTKKTSEAVATVTQINQKTRELEAIAKKQNILALNASIEAARQGASGAGFAVVAEQMGELSNRSASIYKDISKSAEQISTYIEAMEKEL